MKKQIELNTILDFLGSDVLKVYGEPSNIVIHHLRDPQNVDKYTLDWISERRSDKQFIAENTKAIAIIVPEEIAYNQNIEQQKKVLILVDNPKVAIAKIGNNFFTKSIEPIIHPTAVVHPQATIGTNVSIGANSTIGECIIGNNSIIYPNTVILDNVTIGQGVIIQSGAIIGTDGLGCERESDGTLIKFPHLGGVTIEDNVEIGSNCQIAKGAFSETIIGRGSKINADCYIAHNVILEKNVWLSPKVNIAGSVYISHNTTIYSGVIIREQLKIGKQVVIGMGSVVTKNIPDGEIWFGNPAHKK